MSPVNSPGRWIVTVLGSSPERSTISAAPESTTKNPPPCSPARKSGSPSCKRRGVPTSANAAIWASLSSGNATRSTSLSFMDVFSSTPGGGAPTPTACPVKAARSIPSEVRRVGSDPEQHAVQGTECKGGTSSEQTLHRRMFGPLLVEHLVRFGEREHARVDVGPRRGSRGSRLRLVTPVRRAA